MSELSIEDKSGEDQSGIAISQSNNYKDEKGGIHRDKQNGKVLVDAICALLKVNGHLTNKVQHIQNSMSEISAIRQELISMNQKLDSLMEFLNKNPEAKSSFLRYLLS